VIKQKEFEVMKQKEFEVKIWKIWIKMVKVKDHPHPFSFLPFSFFLNNWRDILHGGVCVSHMPEEGTLTLFVMEFPLLDGSQSVIIPLQLLEWKESHPPIDWIDQN